MTLNNTGSTRCVVVSWRAQKNDAPDACDLQQERAEIESENDARERPGDTTHGECELATCAQPPSCAGLVPLVVPRRCRSLLHGASPWALISTILRPPANPCFMCGGSITTALGVVPG
jgi:hypothetical protein